MGELIFNLEAESCAWPFDRVREVINFLTYGSILRVLIEFLFLTGCRLTETQAHFVDGKWRGLTVDCFVGQWVFIPLGKNQKGFRKVKLPDWYLVELQYYKLHNRVVGKAVFGISHTTATRYFNRDIRPHLSSSWKEVTISPHGGTVRIIYVLQLKGLRKSYATLRFSKEYKKWASADIAAEAVSKHMKHSMKHITFHHYIENFEALKIDKYTELSPEAILKGRVQKKLFEYLKA